MTSVGKVDHFVNTLRAQLVSRILTGSVEERAAIEVKISNNAIWVNLTQNGDVHTITIPLPFVHEGADIVEVNGVKRPITQYYHLPTDRVMSYLDVMYEIMLGNTSTVLPEKFKKKKNILQALRYGYENNNLRIIVHSVQRHIYYIVNKLPMFKTSMNAWVVNKRIEVIDPEFDAITNPEDKYKYQVEKNLKFYESRGWSSLGIADGSMASDNYALSVDLRQLTPFGWKFHNPRRNLYSSLGMLGDELPIIRSQSMWNLEQKGVHRTGWNLFTAFVDIPDVWEDQIMVHSDHADKSIEYYKTYTCVGEMKVVDNQQVSLGQALYINEAGEEKKFKVPCDSAYVQSSEKVVVNVSGVQKAATRIVVAYRRYLKDGTKITNMSANKGVIRMRDLGYAIDPRTGEKRRIDVIVSSKAVLKRKNYGQVLEALYNTLNNNKPVVYPDHASASTEDLEKFLTDRGFNKDGSWECETYAGDFKCVCGTVFWGVTHDADDTLWHRNATTATNNRDLRTSGLKFSTIEFRALSTRFGKNNAIEQEVLSYSQGAPDIQEQINVLRSKLGKYVFNSGVVNATSISPAETAAGMLFKEEELHNTISDPNNRTSGFLMRLPVKYQLALDIDNNVIFEGFPADIGPEINKVEVASKIIIDKLYIPGYNLRRAWKHDSGEYGLGGVASVLNSLIVACHNYENDKNSSSNMSILYHAVYNYFRTVEKSLNTKRGELSTLGMSVRYPFSAKAVATLSNDIPTNTVQIHKDMAKDLMVEEGDIVLVERFPCLGFMSLRPQKVTITNDQSCRYTIRASGNSLGSLSLDFDGDVLYIASFHTNTARALLHNEWENPNKHCYEQIQRFNAKMGTPRYKEMNLQDYCISEFEPLNGNTHAAIVGSLVGVKAYTGPVVALAYNLLRIVESSKIDSDPEIACKVEVFVDTVANSVFSLKHGQESLHKVVTKAVCTANVKSLVDKGFDPQMSELICKVVKQKAAKRGVTDLAKHHAKVTKYGGSNVINMIVKEENKLYFTSRADLCAPKLLSNLMSYDVVDIPSDIYSKIITNRYAHKKTPLDKFRDEKMINTLKLGVNDGVRKLFSFIDQAFSASRTALASA